MEVATGLIEVRSWSQAKQCVVHLHSFVVHVGTEMSLCIHRFIGHRPSAQRYPPKSALMASHVKISYIIVSTITDQSTASTSSRLSCMIFVDVHGVLFGDSYFRATIVAPSYTSLTCLVTDSTFFSLPVLAYSPMTLANAALDSGSIVVQCPAFGSNTTSLSLAR